MTVAQGTPRTDQLRKAVEDAWKDGGYQFLTEEEWLDEYGKLESENAALSAQVVESRRIQNRVDKNEVWHWQGDGEDFPESLGCPVIMSADALRALLTQVVELQLENRNLKVWREAAEAHVEALQKQLHSTVTRASVPPSVSDGGKGIPLNPSMGMLKVGAKMYEDCLHSAASFEHHAFHVYCAMVDQATLEAGTASTLAKKE